MSAEWFGGMVDAMKPTHITIGLLLIVLVVVIWASARSSVDPLPMVAESGVWQSMEEPAALSLEPVKLRDTPVEVDAPVVVAIPKHPVEPVEERGDAMLFEIDALHGTPFDDAVVRPFD